MPFTPFISSWLTDFTFLVAPYTRHNMRNPICNKIESKFLDCLEAYGCLRAREKCAELLYDLNECSTHSIQTERGRAMKAERMKQYREGKLARPFEEYPYLDPYLSI